MKLLLCVANVQQIKPALSALGATPAGNDALGYLQPYKILHHEVDVMQTGVGVYQTTYKVTTALLRQKYHLALKLSVGNAYKPEHEPGTVLNIVNEKPGDYGMVVDGEWKDHYDLNLIDRNAEPHVRGGLVNLTNAYMNVLLPYKKSVGVSVNHYADAATYAMRAEKYRADCETGDGIGFTYPCLYQKQSFYHLCAIERNLPAGTADSPKAAEALCATLQQLLQLF